MNYVNLVNLQNLMELTSGRSEIVIGLVDGPVLMNHPDLATGRIYEVNTKRRAACSAATSAACVHGTFVAGMLAAQRGSKAPALCPSCTLLVSPVFAEASALNEQLPSATPEELAAAIIASIEGGARILNLSVGLSQVSSRTERDLEQALDYAAQKSVLTVVAAGNQGCVGSSVLTRHPWVIPVAGCDHYGVPMAQSNLGLSVGRQGLRAPGVAIQSLGTGIESVTLTGTSVAAPFVTGTVALLWSAFPKATAADVKFAVTHTNQPQRTTIVPPLLNAWSAYQAMLQIHPQGVTYGSSQ